MKDLIDELHKLNREEYKVSEDFSKRVIKKIKRDNTYKVIKYVASLASAACVLGLSVFFANKSGVLDRVKDAFGRSNLAQSAISSENLINSANYMQDNYETKADEYNTDESVIETDNEILQVTEEINEKNSVLNDNKKTEEKSEEKPTTEKIEAVHDDPAGEKKDLVIKDVEASDKSEGNVGSVNASKENEETNSKDESIIMSATGNVAEESRTYAKQLNKDDYLKDIIEKLKANKYEVSSKDDGIEINSDDIKAIYDLLEEYTDVVIIYNDGTILVKLKE